MKGKKIAKWVVLGYVIIAFIHPFIANDKPLYCKMKGQTHWPVFSSKMMDYSSADFKIMPIIPFSASTINTSDSFAPPLSGRHLLGTDILGRDTMAGILKGTESAVRIGFISVFIAAVIAIFLGLFSGYFNRFPIRISILQSIILCLSLVLLLYFGWIAFYTSIWYFLLSSFTLLLVNVAVRKFESPKRRTMSLPIDGAYLRIVEAMMAIPGLILILACLSFFKTFSMTGLILTLAFIMWPGLSRYVRAEALKVLSQEYVSAARTYGASGLRIIRVHVLPKLFTSLSVLLAFSIASAVIVEATLSFLGLGLPIDQVSWGSMLKEAQRNISAWWLAVFPGLALFGLILSLNILGERKV